MGSNFISDEVTIFPSVNCIHDSSIGYSPDFSINGEMDGWEYYNGIHTYGVWDGFLFGTLYGELGTIGRTSVFRPVDAATHYFVKLVMKYNPKTRSTKGNHPLPTRGKIRWRTLQNTNWSDDKEIYFNLVPDNNWQTYLINVGVEQWWAGDINDLRVWPASENGEDGDEFFIRTIDIISTESHICRNTACEKFWLYTHPCPWIGLRSTLESSPHSENTIFNIDNLSEFIININNYGNEIVKIREVANGSGREVATKLSNAISKTNVGGYAEVRVEYTDDNTFKIYSGTIHENSSVEIIDNELSRYLKFFNSIGSNTSEATAGETPVDGYSPLSSFKIKTQQALGLLDNDSRTSITFNPFQYSVEGGRRDWLSSSIGFMTAAIGANDGDESTQTVRKYFTIRNEGKTIIDYNHPFNASGRIKKIWVQCTLDDPDYIKSRNESLGTENRKDSELSGAKIMIMRPRRDGSMGVMYEWDLNDRDPNRGYYEALYSLTQEGLDIDVDVFVNKGDLIAVYNANIYVGKSVSGYEYDAQYYQLNYRPGVDAEFNPGSLYGDGSGGLLLYAHGIDTQKRLHLDIDLGERYNLDKIDIKASSESKVLEYNVARCLDINWQVDLFGLQHWTFHKSRALPDPYWYQRPNTAYGKSNLSDGVYNVPDGLACDGYSLTYDSSGVDWNYNAGPGVVPNNPHYFWINGDEEWLGVWLHAQWHQIQQSVHDFEYDPISLFIHFPYGKEKTVYKSKIHFKEKFNFRSFSLSTYEGSFYTSGDADDYHYNLIHEYSKITLDNVEFYDGSPTYSQIKDYLFNNPCSGHMIASSTSSPVYEWDPILSDVVADFGGGSGWFTYQTFAVDNEDEWQTARKTDWQILEHEWEPITCKGWRIYCDFHKSTKITEMELYCVTEDSGSNLAGGININFSNYEEEWWPTESTQKNDSLVEVFIGDSPRYLTLELTPITETVYEDVILYVKTDDLYIGPKGCEYVYYSQQAKTNSTNDGQLIEVKNNYGEPYDLSIDISPGKLLDRGLVFYSDLSTSSSVNNPTVGPDAGYHKFTDYNLVNQDYNCAINCHTFGLNNIIDGATAHASYNDMLNWSEWGQLSHGSSIDFYNLPNISKTTVFLPELSRSYYWKFGLLDPAASVIVREVRAYDTDGNLLDLEFYHDLNKTFTDAPVSERAPHLENISVLGSYYELTEDQYITMYSDVQVCIGRIELYHDGINPYSDTHTFSFYISDTNLFFGHYADVPVLFAVEQYNTYFAIDLSHRYNLDLIRRYGATNDYFIDTESNVIYSNIDTDDPYTAFMTEPTFDTNDSFYGYGGILIDKERWRLADFFAGNEDTHLSIKNGRLEQLVDSNVPNNRFYSNYGIRGDFDLQVKLGKINAPNTFNWWANCRVWMTNEDSDELTYVNIRIQYRSDQSSPYYKVHGAFSDGGTYNDYVANLNDNDSGLRIVRDGYRFYLKYYDNGVWNDLSNRLVYNSKGKDIIRVELGLRCDGTYPATKIYWKDYTINQADKLVMRSTPKDARWMAVEMLNGDGTSRYLKKMGVYSDITQYISPDGLNYNSSWLDLGPSITGYSLGDNLALDTVTSGSSSKGSYLPINVTDGIINNERAHAWLSDNASEQWILIDLGAVKNIYRVKVYHGYSTLDSDFLVEDYRIESSLDNQSFTTRWTIANNTSFTRTHDLADPFTARYIRMYITDYKANNTLLIKEDNGIDYYEWHGACLREIEVYEYYGYSYINSEEWPIVAINLRDQFYIQGHALAGLYTESTTTDWSNDSSNFAWSDSVLQEPKKVSFTAFGAEPDYEQWMVIKRDTATDHNGQVDYLKHALAYSETKENPTNYPWWWSSLISTLSTDFTHAVEISVGSLKISYPNSSALDTVRVIEGSDWGVDSNIAYRDGLGFRWYIEDIDRLDTSEGYVFFGGLDGTTSAQPVEYRWFLNTLSGTGELQSGWNRSFLQFKDADEIIYNENADRLSIIQPTMPEYTQLQTFGLKFKGTGAAFDMNIDGIVVKRNNFKEASKFGNGLYLAGSDYLESPLSEIDLKAGTIEFWMTPDFDFSGLDSHGRFRNRSLFHLGNVANDVFGFMINSAGFNLYFGNMATDMGALVIKGVRGGGIDSLFHIGVVFSANGKHLAGDGSSIKLYMNNELVATNLYTWEYSDEKLFKFTMGGKAPLALIESSNSLKTTSVDSVISNLRIYNYCKTDFTDSMNNTFSENGVDLVLPAKMIEISQDNVTYYKVGAAELPFLYSEVPAGNTVQVYVRSVIPNGLTGQEDRTAGIITSWNVGV